MVKHSSATVAEVKGIVNYTHKNKYNTRVI